MNINHIIYILQIEKSHFVIFVEYIKNRLLLPTQKILNI